MQIDIEHETPVPMGKAPAEVEKLTGTRPHRSTIERWRLRGSRGVRLATFLAGGRRFTTRESILRFLADTTAAADGDHDQAVRSLLTTSRKRAIKAANDELTADNI